MNFLQTIIKRTHLLASFLAGQRRSATKIIRYLFQQLMGVSQTHLSPFTLKIRSGRANPGHVPLLIASGPFGYTHSFCTARLSQPMLAQENKKEEKPAAPTRVQVVIHSVTEQERFLWGSEQNLATPVGFMSGNPSPFKSIWN